MKSKFGMAILIASLTAPVIVPVTAADAQYRQYQGRNKYYRNRSRCKRSSGTTGLIAGGAGGALLGSALGGGAVGTIAGGVGGALLGKHLDKKHDTAQNRRNGC